MLCTLIFSIKINQLIFYITCAIRIWALPLYLEYLYKNQFYFLTSKPFLIKFITFQKEKLEAKKKTGYKMKNAVWTRIVRQVKLSSGKTFCWGSDEIFWKSCHFSPAKRSSTAKKMKFSIKNFFSKYDQIRSFLWIWSHLLKKSLVENFIFCVVPNKVRLVSSLENSLHYFCSNTSF